jgi:tRNA(Ile)-lysidine synthase
LDTVTLAQLGELPTALARLVVQRLADGAQGRPAPGCARRLPDILALSPTGTSHLDLPNGVRASAVDGVLTFGLTPIH